MATSDADLWHQVHAQREDGVPAMFLIRDVEPRPDQPQIFVIEMPYPISDLSKLPDDAGYRRLERFQDEWIEPACEALGWTFVAWKSEDGSFSFYLYGNGDPNALLAKLAPFDGALSFFHDRDADWSEYAGLRELVEQAEAADEDDDEGAGDHVHTDDCDHEHDGEAMSHTIEVVDLTGERPAGTARAGTGKAAKPRAAKPRPRADKPRPRAAKPRPRTAKAAPAKPTSRKPVARPASKKVARPASKKAAKLASKKAAKPAPAKAKAKPTAKRPAAPPRAARMTANRAGAGKPATKPAGRKPAKSER